MSSNTGVNFGFDGSDPALDRLVEFNGDVGCLRPWYDVTTNKTYITLNAGTENEESIVQNAPSTMTKEQYLELDTVVIEAARARMNYVADLNAQGRTYSVRNGMATMMLQYQKMKNLGPATISMDGLAPDQRERPTFDSGYLPLPIIHKGFGFPLRQLLASRQGQIPMPLDTTLASQCGEAIGEYVEALALGTAETYSFDGYPIYGLKNHPDKIAVTITAPTAPGWTPKVLYDELLSARQMLYDIRHYGPYNILVAPAWDEYLDNDYSLAKGNDTLRTKILGVEKFKSLKTSDFYTGFELTIEHQSAKTSRMVNAMGIVTVNWTGHGGLSKDWKIMTIQVPQVRPDANDDLGIVYATTA